MPRFCFAVLAVLSALATADADELSSFPRPPALEPDIRFWIRVYTEVDTQGGLIHDRRNLDVVYQVIRFPPGLAEGAQEPRIDKAKQRYRDILLKLAEGERQNLDSEARRVLSLWPKNVSNRTLRAAARRLRFQRGHADSFRGGLIRSGAWAPYIRRTLSEMGLPLELAALPHVESSYNPTAYSHAGAAGLWQFTRSTGRRFLRIDHVMDERWDPLRATLAAARLLKYNRGVTGSWPLAITAYNHGAAGMRRATRELGTRDIAPIVRRYRSPSFRFASRNFYVAFLAALDVERDAEKFFGPLRRDAPVDSEIVEIPAYLSVATLVQALGVDSAMLRRDNPVLQPSVWNGSKYIPRGYPLRVSRNLTRAPATEALASIADSERFAAQIPDHAYKVRRGNTLSAIAARFGVSPKHIVELNGLRNRHHIRVGQVLLLPPPHTSNPTAVASAGSSPVEPSPRFADGLYRVRRGDTFSSIARRFGVDETQLLAANHLRNKDRIYVDQTLQVSASTAEVAGPATAVPASLTLPAAGSSATAVAATSVSELDMAAVEIGAVEAAEPARAEGAQGLEAVPSLGIQPALAADPSDYSVASDGTIEVQAAETLGHYAEWLQLRARRLRRINNIKYGRPLVIGQRLGLDFARVNPEIFAQRRLAHHRSLQAAFFQQFQITGTGTHVVRPGDSLWILSQREYAVPVWLLRQYNPDLNFKAVVPGTRITIPRLERRLEETPPTDTT